MLLKIKVRKVYRAKTRALTGEQDTHEAGKALLSLGPEEILLTHEEGVSVFTEGNDWHFPWKNKSMNGRTGRGDTAFMSYLGSRINQNPKNSARFCAALTSLKLEHRGPFTQPLFRVEKLIREEY